MFFSRRSLSFFLLFFGLAFFDDVKCQVLEINEKTQIISPNSDCIKIVVDSHSNFSYQDIFLAKNEVARFYKNGILDFGSTDFSYWCKIEISNQSNGQYLKLAEPLIDIVDVYFVDDTLLLNKVMTGALRKFNTRQVSVTDFLFQLPKGNYTCYIKLKGNFGLQVPITIGPLKNHMEHQHFIDIILSLYFGFMLIMIVYNLFIYLSLKDRAYLYYILYIIFVTLFYASLKGFSFEYFWGDIPYLNFFIPALASVINIFAAIFIIYLLQTKVNVPFLHKGILFFIGVFIVAIILNLIGYYETSTKLSQSFTALFSIYLIYAGVLCYKRGVKTATFFLIAWTLYLIAVFIFILKLNGVIVNNVFTNNVVLYGSALEALMLSLALADKINTLQKEKEKEQLEKLAVVKENETIIREQNITLERKVVEKTKELTSANEELSTALYNLKSTQVSLVESEKMASLGQLTAGVAHEINNPINFVSSNVKPLIRDFEDLASFLTAFKTQQSSEAGVDGDELLKIFNKLDLDYTIKEVGELLNGIQEGANRTAEIVKGLKNFSRLDEAEFKTANIEEGLDSTLILLRSNLKGEIELIKKYGKVPEIDCFAGKLNQVFMNLINNSIYAIFKQTGRPNNYKGQIILETEDLGENIAVIIQDNGEGMDKETLNKLFEPFFTTKPVGEGTGLGMSITYNIINELHKGRLEVESEIDVGTKITILLPKGLKR